MTSRGNGKIMAQKLKIPIKIDFIRAALLAYEVDFVVHIVTFFEIFSTSNLCSILLDLLAVIRTPRYRNGNTPSWYPVIALIRSCCITPITICDFSLLATKPVLFENLSKAYTRNCTDLVSATLKTIRSCANMRCIICNFLQFAWNLSLGRLLAYWKV